MFRKSLGSLGFPWIAVNIGMPAYTLWVLWVVAFGPLEHRIPAALLSVVWVFATALGMSASEEFRPNWVCSVVQMVEGTEKRRKLLAWLKLVIHVVGIVTLVMSLLVTVALAFLAYVS